MKFMYLVAAILGAIVPYVFFLQHMDVHGLALATFVAQAFANPVASGFTSDLLISSFVFWVYMFNAGNNAPKPWAFIVINLFVGLSCALPAYLYWRMRSTMTHTAHA